MFGKQQHHRNIYTHAVSSKKRRAKSKVVEMILPEEKNDTGRGGCGLVCIVVCRAIAPISKSQVLHLQ